MRKMRKTRKTIKLWYTQQSLGFVTLRLKQFLHSSNVNERFLHDRVFFTLTDTIPSGQGAGLLAQLPTGGDEVAE